MELSVKMFLIVCPMLFLAGFVDSIAGGGALISLPAYVFAGLPMHLAIGTNKLSSACGTSLATARFIRHRLMPRWSRWWRWASRGRSKCAAGGRSCATDALMNLRSLQSDTLIKE